MDVNHGQLSYLQVPAIDLVGSAEFYERVFGWRIERPHPSFTAPGLIGQWVTDRAPAGDAGILAWIHVDDIEAAIELVRASGGDLIEPAAADGPNRQLATIRDPAGNVLGIVAHRPG